MNPPLPMAALEVYHLKWKGQRSGPYSLRELEDKLQRREVSSLHEIEVGGKWMTVRAFMATRSQPTARPPTNPAPVGSRLPPPTISAARDARPPSTPPPSPLSFDQPKAAIPLQGELPKSSAAAPADGSVSFYLMSNFGVRAVALFIDTMLFLTGLLVMQQLGWISLGSPPWIQGVAKLPEGLWVLEWLLVCWIAGILMEGSPLQGTPGKWMLGLAVVDRDGLPLRTGQAFKRGTLRVLGALPFGFGWFMAAFNQEARTMHDIVADTHVVIRVTSARIFH